MRFTIQYPMPHPPSPDFLDPTNIARVAQAAEAAGFDAIAFTEHPAPSHKWLTAGGHESFDPLVALSFCAAMTERLRLMPFLMVVPYHQPFLGAKSAASVDVLSRGRLTMVVGSGYLRSEFSALGVEFDDRNELLDEGIEVMRAAWTTEQLELEGRGYEARGMTARPRPVQTPHPPIWVGGNSRAARRRAALMADGWSPNQYSVGAAKTTRTAALGTHDELAAAISDLHEMRAEAGRTSTAFDVQALTAQSRDLPGAVEADAHLDHLAALAEIGVTWFVMNAPHDDVEHCIDRLAAYGEYVIARSPSVRPTGEV